MSRNLPALSSSKWNWLAAQRLQRFQKGRVCPRAAGVVELPRAAELREPLHHAPDRRDADAAGEQDDVGGVLLQREVVARRADLERLADPQLVVDVARAAAARRIALDADRVGRGIALGIDERILPDDAVREMHVDMGAGLVVGQRLAVHLHEFVEIGVARRVADRRQPHVDQSVRRLRVLPPLPRRGWQSPYSPTRLLRLRAEMRHRARGRVCQIPGLRYALAQAIPTGGKSTRIRAALMGLRGVERGRRKADRGNDHTAPGEDSSRGFAKSARLSIAVGLIGRGRVRRRRYAGVEND